jgi:hypothetical protein
MDAIPECVRFEPLAFLDILHELLGISLDGADSSGKFQKRLLEDFFTYDVGGLLSAESSLQMWRSSLLYELMKSRSLLNCFMVVQV